MESSKFVVAVMLSLAAIVGLHTVAAATLPLEQPLSSSMVSWLYLTTAYAHAASYTVTEQLYHSQLHFISRFFFHWLQVVEGRIAKRFAANNNGKKF